MSDGTAIEWTDATWNIITGCDIESPGCKNCYAMKLAGTRLQHHPSRAGLTTMTAAGPVWNGQVRFNEEWLKQPLAWTRPRDIFVCAHGDLFHPNAPFAWIDRVFAVMAKAQHHRFQVLTKRPARALEYLNEHAPGGRNVWAAAQTIELTPQQAARVKSLDLDWPLRNVLIGCSVENQRYADERAQAMRDIASIGWATWCSYEPALGPMNWAGWEFLKWIVSGGESGRRAREHHPDWHRATRDFCAERGIAFLFKQWGEWGPTWTEANVHRGLAWQMENHDPSGNKAIAGTRVVVGEHSDGRVVEALWPVVKVGKAAAGRLLDGVVHDAFPEAAPCR